MNTLKINPTDILDPLRGPKELLAQSKWREAADVFQQITAESPEFDAFDTTVVAIRIEAGLANWAKVEKMCRGLLDQWDHAAGDALLLVWQMLIVSLDVQQKDAEATKVREEAIDFFYEKTGDFLDVAARHFRSLIKLDPGRDQFPKHPGLHEALMSLPLDGDDAP